MWYNDFAQRDRCGRQPMTEEVAEECQYRSLTEILHKRYIIDAHLLPRLSVGSSILPILLE